MRAGGPDLRELWVEGRNDLYVVTELMQRHLIGMSPETRPFTIRVPKDARDRANGADELIKIVGSIVKTNDTRPVGFVLDADGPDEGRWRKIRGRLRTEGFTVPENYPLDGYISNPNDIGTTAGVWLMCGDQATSLPDSGGVNNSEQPIGALEDFLETLVPAGESILSHAKTSTDKAAELGAPFPPKHRKKAILHCWLAWQSCPGVPYGTAINSLYFNHDSHQALTFLRWLHRLYGIPALSSI